MPNGLIKEGLSVYINKSAAGKHDTPPRKLLQYNCKVYVNNIHELICVNKILK